MSLPAKDQKNWQEKKNKSNVFYTLLLGLELGFLIALPLVIFLILGIFLDKKFQSFPISLILSVILGLVFTFLDVYYIVLPFLDKRSEK
ncbi:MAG: AtpZ/AtpI family protein [Candidatus Paceibacterota bacterium]